MAVKRTSNRKPPRISLKRPGSKGASNAWKSRPIAPKERRNITLPKLSLGKLAPRLFLAFSTIILVCSISFCLIYSYRYVTTTPYFQINSPKVEGNTRLSSQNILDFIGVYEGMNIFSFSIAKIERKLQTNAWVQHVSVTRLIPDTLIIKVEEKTPFYWVLEDQTLWYTDEVGTRIAPVNLGQFAPLPTLVIEKGATNHASSLPELMQSLHEANLPIDMAHISDIRLSASRIVEFFISKTNIRITIGLDGWVANLYRTKETLDDLLRRGELSEVRTVKAVGHNVWVETAKPL